MTTLSSGTLDIFDGFNPRGCNVARGAGRFSAAERILSLAKSAVTPFMDIFNAAKHLYGRGRCTS